VGRATNAARPTEAHSSLEQDRAHREVPPEYAGEERSDDGASAEGRDERTDLAAREPLPLADHHHGQHQAGEHEVREREDQRNSPQERMPPQEAETLGDLRADACGVGVVLLLKRRAHRDQRPDREDVRDRVDDEGERAGDTEERAAERRSGESHDRHARLHGARGRGHLAWWHDRAHRAVRRDAEERRSGSFHECHAGDEPDRKAAVQDRGGERRDRNRLHDVGGEHHALAVPAVRGNAREQAEHRRREKIREADDPGLRRRVGEREHEQRIGNRSRLRPGRREQLAGLQQDEVPVTAERDLGHSRDDSNGRARVPDVPNSRVELCVGAAGDSDRERAVRAATGVGSSPSRRRRL